MDEDIKELVKRLRYSAITLNRPGGILNPSDWLHAADALEAIAGEVAFVKAQLAGTNKNIAGWLQARDDATKRAEAAESERNRLKAEYDAYRETSCESIDRLKAALEVLARLGNEPHYGNSDGNLIARSALEAKP